MLAGSDHYFSFWNLPHSALLLRSLCHLTPVGGCTSSQWGGREPTASWPRSCGWWAGDSLLELGTPPPCTPAARGQVATCVERSRSCDSHPPALLTAPLPTPATPQPVSFANDDAHHCSSILCHTTVMDHVLWHFHPFQLPSPPLPRVCEANLGMYKLKPSIRTLDKHVIIQQLYYSYILHVSIKIINSLHWFSLEFVWCKWCSRKKRKAMLCFFFRKHLGSAGSGEQPTPSIIPAPHYIRRLLIFVKNLESLSFFRFKL